MAGTNGGSTTKGTLTRAGTIAAYLLLIGLGIFTVYLITATDKNDTEWQRLAWLYGGIEALAFAGAGALFGTTVQRARVEDAEKKAKDNQKDAENGRTLAKIIQADAPHTQTGNLTLESMGVGAGTPGAQLARRHAQHAEELFPSA
jgi:hypothetical protein